MATPIQNALKRKKELERELAEIDRFIALYDQFSKSRAAPTDRESQPTNRESSGTAVGTGTARAEGTTAEKMRGRPAEFAVLMEKMIRDHNRPLSRTELVDIFERSDVTIPSEDKPRYLGTILWRRRDRFINVSGKGYIMDDMLTPEQAAKERRMSDMFSEDADVESGDDQT